MCQEQITIETTTVPVFTATYHVFLRSLRRVESYFFEKIDPKLSKYIHKNLLPP